MVFDDDFTLLTDNPPFPWQRAFPAASASLRATFPLRAICRPASGRRASLPFGCWRLPRTRSYRGGSYTSSTGAQSSTNQRLRPSACRSRLLEPAAPRHLHGPRLRAGDGAAKHPLAISTLRGEFADNGAWRRDPSRPAIIVGTVDMIGSRLLFSGYGCGFRSRPHALASSGKTRWWCTTRRTSSPHFRRCSAPSPTSNAAAMAPLHQGACALGHRPHGTRFHAR